MRHWLRSTTRPVLGAYLLFVATLLLLLACRALVFAVLLAP